MTASRPPPVARSPARRRLRLALRGLFLLAGGLSLAASLLHASRMLDVWLGGDPVRDDAQARQTILVALAEAATSGEIDARIQAELRPVDGSLDDEGVARAGLFLGLADRLALPLRPETRALYAAATTPFQQALRYGRQCVRGFGSGAGLTPAALACAAAGDLLLWGDIRDLGHETWHAVTGAPVDPVLMGLAAGGLGLTALTLVSDGAAAPARFGASAAKAAARAAARDTARLARPAVAAVATAADLRATTRLARIFGKDGQVVADLLGKRAQRLLRTSRLGWRKLMEAGGFVGWLLGSLGTIAGSLATGSGSRHARRWVLRRI